MDINRLKIVLVEKKKTSKWLAEQLKVNPSTVSKWCTNTSQPPLESIISISKLLNVDINNGSLKFEITAKRLYAASQRVL